MALSGCRVGVMHIRKKKRNETRGGKKDVRRTQVLVVRALELRAPSVEDLYMCLAVNLSTHANPVTYALRGDWWHRVQISDENLGTYGKRTVADLFFLFILDERSSHKQSVTVPGLFNTLPGIESGIP